MSENKDLARYIRLISKAVTGIAILIILIGAAIIYITVDPQLTAFSPKMEKTEIVEKTSAEQKDVIEDGIHVKTGLIVAEGYKTVIQNCTNCHSSKLIIQNRMTAEKWNATIRWMQETQNLWDLGDKQEIIVNYLVTNYPLKKKGRRENLTNIEWYELD